MVFLWCLVDESSDFGKGWVMAKYIKKDKQQGEVPSQSKDLQAPKIINNNKNLKKGEILAVIGQKVVA